MLEASWSQCGVTPTDKSTAWTCYQPGWNLLCLPVHTNVAIANGRGNNFSISYQLFDSLQFPYLDRESWKALKPDIWDTCSCNLNYTNYLKRMLLNHLSNSPVQQIVDNITFQLLFCNWFAWQASSQWYVWVHCSWIRRLLPKWLPYFIKAMKSQGFPYHAALMTYAHGNNIGNLNYVWKVSSNNDTSFSDCQLVTDCVSKSIPSYHTRAMRRQLFQRFGHLTSSVKTAIMRFIYRFLTGESTRLQFVQDLLWDLVCVCVCVCVCDRLR